MLQPIIESSVEVLPEGTFFRVRAAYGGHVGVGLSRKEHAALAHAMRALADKLIKE